MDNALLADPVRAPQLRLAPVDAADLIVRSLEELGVEYVFGIPGGAIEPLYNALARSARRGGPKPVVARHESGAAFMADGYARETGRLGVCIATSGPGATNLITGVACAHENQVPMLVLTGQSPQPSWGKRSLQESSCSGIDTVAMLRHCTRYSSLVSHPDQLWPKLTSALAKAQGAPQGPAHLSLPVDLLRGPLPAPPSPGDGATALLRRLSEPVDADAVRQLHALLVAAERPVFVIGQGCAEAAPHLMRLVQLHHALFATTPDGKGLVHPRHPSFRGVFGFGGHAAAEALLAGEPDLIVAFGTTFGEFNSSGWAPGLMNRRLVHVDNCEENLMRSPMARLHVLGRLSTVCRQLIALQSPDGNVLRFPERRAAPIAADALLHRPEAWHAEGAPIKPQRLMKALSERCTPNTCFVADAGNSAVWAAHCLSRNDRRWPRAFHDIPALTRERRQRRAAWLHVPMDFMPMGWAIGAAVGIAAARPRSPVVCLTGDGSYLMNGQEITVAAALRLPVVFVVLNDGALGMVKHGQRLAGAERVAFELPPVDYAALAAAMGVPGHVVRSAADIEALDFDAILRRAGPTMLDVRIDPEEVPPMNLRMRTLGTGQ